MAIFLLKRTIDFYRNQDAPVYMWFLDAKKTFDRVNHWTLAKKLLDRNVPLLIVKLYIFWYREQEFMVRWGNSLSMTFLCANGIRQGGQLSPLLYNVLEMYRVFASASADNAHCFDIRIHIRIRFLGVIIIRIRIRTLQMRISRMYSYLISINI